MALTADTCVYNGKEYRQLKEIRDTKVLSTHKKTNLLFGIFVQYAVSHIIEYSKTYTY